MTGRFRPGKPAMPAVPDLPPVKSKKPIFPRALAYYAREAPSPVDMGSEKQRFASVDSDAVFPYDYRPPGSARSSGSGRPRRTSFLLPSEKAGSGSVGHSNGSDLAHASRPSMVVLPGTSPRSSAATSPASPDGYSPRGPKQRDRDEMEQARADSSDDSSSEWRPVRSLYSQQTAAFSTATAIVGKAPVSASRAPAMSSSRAAPMASRAETDRITHQQQLSLLGPQHQQQQQQTGGDLAEGIYGGGGGGRQSSLSGYSEDRPGSRRKKDRYALKHTHTQPGLFRLFYCLGVGLPCCGLFFLSFLICRPGLCASDSYL